jgi:hypothetical protein
MLEFGKRDIVERWRLPNAEASGAECAAPFAQQRRSHAQRRAIERGERLDRIR